MQVAKRDLIVSARNLYLIGREKVQYHTFYFFFLILFMVVFFYLFFNVLVI